MDTQDKRSSAILVGLPFRGQLPQPGSLDQPDRQQLAHMYRGIAATADAIPLIFGDLTTLFWNENADGYVWTLRNAAANTLKDTTSLVMLDVGDVRSATNSPDDYNTALAEYLS